MVPGHILTPAPTLPHRILLIPSLRLIWPLLAHLVDGGVSLSLSKSLHLWTGGHYSWHLVGRDRSKCFRQDGSE